MILILLIIRLKIIEQNANKNYALPVVVLASATFFCLSLCWLVLCLIYTVFSLMVLSVSSFPWSCGALCLQWCLFFSYFFCFWCYYIFLPSPFFLKKVFPRILGRLSILKVVDIVLFLTWGKSDVILLWYSTL